MCYIFISGAMDNNFSGIQNNTNLPVILTEKIKNDLENDTNYKNKNLFDYQKIVYNYLVNTDARGLLIYHTVGTGKTLSAVSIAEYFRNKGREILILAPKSLHNNMVKTIKQYNRNISENEITKGYKFITSNASNMIKQLDTSDKLDIELNEINKIKLDNKIIIIDESHTLSNSIVNGSKNANELYDLVMNAKNIKVLFLTGSPIVNDAFELCPIFNMCKGKIFKQDTNLVPTNKKKDFFCILPEYYNDFRKIFIDEKTNSIINKEYFQNRIFGLISYHGELYIEKKEDFMIDIKETKKKEHFPDRLPIKIIKINMSLEQNIEYSKYRDKEKYEASRNFKNGGAIFKEKFSTTSSYRIKSRQISNCYIKENEQFDITKLHIYSPKLQKLYEIIKNCHKKQLGLIYSTFLASGLEYMAKILDYHNYSAFNDELNIDIDSKQIEPKLRYALFTGKIDIEIRNYIINIFNSPENKNGELIQLLLISSTGEKGINLKRVRHIHIIEPQWSYSTIEQVIGRGVRYNSHIDLSENQQNVQIYMYISEYNEEYLKKEKEKNQLIKQKNNKKIEPIEDTTDKTLFFRSIKNKELNDKFLKILAETAIDCEKFNKEYNFECYSCIPSNEPLYYPDIDIDINIPNRCIRNKKVSTEEVVIENKAYYYTKDGDELKVYKQNENDENYHEIHNKHIIDIIKKSIK
jgi:African swine fever virus helicase